MAAISAQISAAFSASRMTIITVSSPAMEPTICGSSMPSNAAPAAPARPGMVLSTTMFWA